MQIEWAEGSSRPVPGETCTVASVEESPRDGVGGAGPYVTLSDGSRFINPLDLRKNKFALMTKLQGNPGNLLEMFIAMDEVQLEGADSKEEEVRAAAAQSLKQVRVKLESIFNRDDRYCLSPLCLSVCLSVLTTETIGTMTS